MELRNLGWPFLVVELLTMKSKLFPTGSIGIKTGLGAGALRKNVEPAWEHHCACCWTKSRTDFTMDAVGSGTGFCRFLLLTLSAVKQSLNNGILFIAISLAASSSNVIIMSSCSSSQDEQKATMVSDQWCMVKLRNSCTPSIARGEQRHNTQEDALLWECNCYEIKFKKFQCQISNPKYHHYLSAMSILCRKSPK